MAVLLVFPSIYFPNELSFTVTGEKKKKRLQLHKFLWHLDKSDQSVCEVVYNYKAPFLFMSHPVVFFVWQQFT